MHQALEHNPHKVAHLHEDDGYKEVVDDHGLGGPARVVLEEEVGEGEDHVLARRVREAGAQQLQRAHRQHQRPDTATWKGGD